MHGCKHEDYVKRVFMQIARRPLLSRRCTNFAT